MFGSMKPFTWKISTVLVWNGNKVDIDDFTDLKSQTKMFALDERNGMGFDNCF